MRHPYDPNKPDPLGIHAEVERERLASRYRDRSSRGHVHPIDADVGALIDFAASRRLRQPDVLNLLRRVLHRVDTPAIRLLVAMVLTKGSCDRHMKRRCARLIEYCDTLDFALAVKAEYARLAGPLREQIAANEAETARLKAEAVLRSTPTTVIH